MATSDHDLTPVSPILLPEERYIVAKDNADCDLDALTRDELTERLLAVRSALRWHRDLQGNQRCWIDDLALYELLPETTAGDFALPPKREFLGNCERYWELRGARCPAVPDGPTRG